MRAAAVIEHAGVPMDQAMLQRLVPRWHEIKLKLIARVCADYPVFEGTTLKHKLLEAWLLEQGIGAWPRTDTGRLSLEEKTFDAMVRAYPIISPIREAYQNLAQLRLTDLAVGSDGRNRCLLSAFRASTGRNQPSNTKFIFGPSTWLRSLIKPSR
jgi:DNA polymerase I